MLILENRTESVIIVLGEVRRTENFCFFVVKSSANNSLLHVLCNRFLLVSLGESDLFSHSCKQLLGDVGGV